MDQKISACGKDLIPLLFVEVAEYAIRLGIDPELEPELLYLAEQGLLAHLPPHWKPW